MRPTSSLVLLGVLASGCGGSTGAVAPGHAPGGASESLAAALEREVGAGRAVAIVGGQTGVRAISSDGARERTLAPGNAPWVIVDHRSQVVWFGSEDLSEVRAIDLDAPAAAPIDVRVIAARVPDGRAVAMVGPPRYEVVYPSQEPGISEGEAAAGGERFATASEDLMRASIAVVVGPAPRVHADSGYLEDDDWDAAAAKVELRDRAFVARLLERDHPRPPGRPYPPEETRVEGIDAANCDEAEDCGRAQPIAGTSYLRVMTGNVMGDVRHVSWQLYDPAARTLLASEWAGWFADAWLSPDASAFLAEGVVVRFDGGPLAATPPDGAGLGGGWLGGGTFYGRFY